MQDERAVTKVSSKHRIALPARMCRALGLKEGDKLTVILVDGQMVSRPQPKSYVEEFHGRLKGVYGSEQEIEEYLREKRASWSRESAE